MPVPLCLEQFAARPTVHRIHRCFCGDLRQEYHQQLVTGWKQVLKWVPRNDARMTFPGHPPPDGVGVANGDERLCMTMRDARAGGLSTITSAWRGAVIDDDALQVESLVLAAGS